MKTKLLKQPPLPFQGSKRYFINLIINTLLDLESQGFITRDTIFVEVFGGSGIISHNIKRVFSNNHVVWNDYDDYESRLKNIEATNELLEKIDVIRQKNKAGFRVSEDSKNEILALIQNELDTGNYVDFITLSAYLLFQSNYAQNIDDLKKYAFYARSSSFKPFVLYGYLENVERISCDFAEAIKQYEGQNAFFIYDPPYLFSNEKAYSAKWSMRNFLQLMALATPPFIFFSHTDSGILDFIECFSGFENIQIKQKQRTLTKTKTYEEYMILQTCPPPERLCGTQADFKIERIKIGI